MAYSSSSGGRFRGREVIPRMRTLYASRGGRLFTVAEILGPRHVQAARLSGEGKSLSEIARIMKTSPLAVSKLFAGLKVHLTHWENTGKPPQTQLPTKASRERAKALVAFHFPDLKNRKARMAARVISYGIEGRLPPRVNDLYLLRRIIDKAPGEFPWPVRDTLQKKKSVRAELAAVLPQIQTAAERGDKRAIKIINGLSLKDLNREHDKLVRGVGLAARHPDLFLKTYPPTAISEVHPAALELHRETIERLAEAGSRVGITMLKFINGKSHRRITREMGLSLERVQRNINYGGHALYNIPPALPAGLKEFERVRRKYRHAFQN
ncbi:MAG: hypothetical protein V1644_02130 [Candidatus Micrarchaeota archaeon]